MNNLFSNINTSTILFNILCICIIIETFMIFQITKIRDKEIRKISTYYKTFLMKYEKEVYGLINKNKILTEELTKRIANTEKKINKRK